MRRRKQTNMNCNTRNFAESVDLEPSSSFNPKEASNVKPDLGRSPGVTARVAMQEWRLVDEVQAIFFIFIFFCSHGILGA